jgi:hypothetical protein
MIVAPRSRRNAAAARRRAVSVEPFGAFRRLTVQISQDRTTKGSAMFHTLPRSARTLFTAAALAFSLFGMAGTASAQAVVSVDFEVRTGGDNLRGGNDNAIITVFTRGGGIAHEQLNRSNRELKDYTTTRWTVPLPRGTQLDDISAIALSVKGFNGGFDGDNWNVDGLRVTALLDDDRRIVLMNEYASPLIRFTGENKFFSRNIR